VDSEVRLRQGYGGQSSRGLPTVAHASVGKREGALVSLTVIEPVSVDYREKSLTVEEIRLAGWSRKLCPRLCPNGCLLPTNTVAYGETSRDIFPVVSR
jgi:hypothetical protein